MFLYKSVPFSNLLLHEHTRSVDQFHRWRFHYRQLVRRLLRCGQDRVRKILYVYLIFISCIFFRNNNGLGASETQGANDTQITICLDGCNRTPALQTSFFQYVLIVILHLIKDSFVLMNSSYMCNKCAALV